MIYRNYLVEIAEAGDESAVALQKAKKEEQEQHQRMMEYNRLENERVAVLREKR